jgi:hypothetical protein
LLYRTAHFWVSELQVSADGRCKRDSQRFFPSNLLCSILSSNIKCPEWTHQQPSSSPRRVLFRHSNRESHDQQGLTYHCYSSQLGRAASSKACHLNGTPGSHPRRSSLSLLSAARPKRPAASHPKRIPAEPGPRRFSPWQPRHAENREPIGACSARPQQNTSSIMTTWRPV